MARVYGMFGTRLSGKVGDLVYYTSRGKECVRSAPKKSEVEASPAQQLNRQRFLLMTKFTNQFRFVVIPQIWNLATKKMPGRSFFIKSNQAAFDIQGNLIDLKLLKLSVGNLYLPTDIFVERNPENPSLIDVSWKENYYKGGITFWDELLVISTGGSLFSTIKNTGIKRGELKGSFTLPELKAEATHVYLFFASVERTKYSESICFEV